MNSYIALDRQMATWSSRLLSDVGLSGEDVSKLATILASEVRFLPSNVKAEVAAASPVPIAHRLEELSAFQLWMDQVRDTRNPPSVRAQVLAGNYICFVYMPETFFKSLAKAAGIQSALKRCATFLTDGRVRSFRNAIAHANWRYREDFDAMVYWARKGSDPNESLAQFEVGNDELQFWQSLSRCVGNVAALNLQ